MLRTQPKPDDSPREARRDARPIPIRRSRRSPRWIAAGVLAVCLGALGSAALYAQATKAVPVVLVQEHVAKGEVVKSSDLRVIRAVPNEAVSVERADRMAALIGQTALFDLAQDTILPRGAIGKPNVDADSSLVGVKLAPGRLPGIGVAPGTNVTLVSLPPAQQQPVAAKPAEESVAGFAATVTGTPTNEHDGSHVVTVRVRRSDAAKVAQLAAAERLALMVEARR